MGSEERGRESGGREGSATPLHAAGQSDVGEKGKPPRANKPVRALCSLDLYSPNQFNS